MKWNIFLGKVAGEFVLWLKFVLTLWFDFKTLYIYNAVHFGHHAEFIFAK